ncbi:hypothetical protein CLAUDI_8 [Bacillus phage Claudi]|uniref:Uncharacterized protein n=1 Tax=Bacillus phage Claudi TaxID=1874001 RepID=A0A1B1PAI3_9CAUD|nr:hypothetical protein MUK67_gp08 [Bacillus phage Claudi]ANT41162.1 hypothetical protein CLAUDI_8 [Bacillus phage Claudi]
MKRQVRVILKHKKFLEKLLKRNILLRRNFRFNQHYLKIIKELEKWGVKL